MSAKHPEIEAGAKRKKAVAKGKGAADGGVESFLRTLKHPLKTEIEAVRRIILDASPKIDEGVKWNAPSFRTESDWFATFNLRAEDSVQLIFHLGAKKRADLKGFEIADPNGLMKWLGKDRALLTLGAGRDISANRKALEMIVCAWIKHV